MLVPRWFEEKYGQDNACSGWYIEINNGEYKLVPYGIHIKTKEELKSSESHKQEKMEDHHKNIVSKAASQVGDVVKQVADAGSTAVKQEVNSLR